MPRWTCVLLLLAACATANSEIAELEEQPLPPGPTPSAQGPATRVIVLRGAIDSRDFGARVIGPRHCAQGASALLATAPEDAWQTLRACAADTDFTELRSLLGAWDRELATRRDAPDLLARVIAQRGGAVESDLELLHEHQIPIFSLAQVIAQPELPRGVFVLLRGHVGDRGLVEEMQLVGASREVAIVPAYHVASSSAGFFGDSRSDWLDRRSYNLDVPTGRRAVTRAPALLDPDDVVVLLARFDGVREGLWPEVSILAVYRPSAVLSH